MNDRNKSAVLECCINKTVEIEFKNGQKLTGVLYHGEFVIEKYNCSYFVGNCPYCLIGEALCYCFYKSQFKKCRVV